MQNNVTTGPRIGLGEMAEYAHRFEHIVLTGVAKKLIMAAE